MTFGYDKMEDRDFAERTLRLLSNRLCDYRLASGGPLGHARCDCKYGIADHPDVELTRHHSEQTGCPELLLLAEIIKATPKREWQRLVRKAFPKKAKRRTRA